MEIGQGRCLHPACSQRRPTAKPNGNHLSLVANIERLALKADNILPLHGRIVPTSELYRMVGK